MGDLPPKLFFRIGEVAGLVGVEPHVLRYWEREFRSIRPTKSAKGQRVYSRKDVENLLRVRDLLYRDGFTIAGAKKKLQRGTEPVLQGVEQELLAAAAEPARPQREAMLQAPAPLRVSTSPPEPIRPQREAMRQAPAPPRVSTSPPDSVREKLVALRSEVEEFLAELSSSARR